MIPVVLQTNEPNVDWPEAMIAVGGIAMVTIIVVVSIWQIFLSWRAKMSVAREEAYRQLAETSAEAQQDLSGRQQRMSEDLAAVSQRLANIERILQQVE
jgi:hypothetical protein